MRSQIHCRPGSSMSLATPESQGKCMAPKMKDVYHMAVDSTFSGAHLTRLAGYSKRSTTSATHKHHVRFRCARLSIEEAKAVLKNDVMEGHLHLYTENDTAHCILLSVLRTVPASYR